MEFGYTRPMHTLGGDPNFSALWSNGFDIVHAKVNWFPRTPGKTIGFRRFPPGSSRRAARMFNRFGASWPEMRRKPGTDTNFRRSLPEFGCLSQGLPRGI